MMVVHEWLITVFLLRLILNYKTLSDHGFKLL